MRSQAKKCGLALAVIAPILLAPAVQADVTSPDIKDKGKRYTQEKAHKEIYGTSSSGRLVEASELRILVDGLIADGEWEAAIPKARKAVQLDPGDPGGHLALARILTRKFYDTKGRVDEKLLNEVIGEWQIIRFHDVDPTEQWEAGQTVKKLQKIAKAIEKDKLEREKARERAEKESLVAGRGRSSDERVSTVQVSSKVKQDGDATDDSADGPSTNTDSSKKPIAGKKPKWYNF
jgi:hypothetical protein